MAQKLNLYDGWLSAKIDGDYKKADLDLKDQVARLEKSEYNKFVSAGFKLLATYLGAIMKVSVKIQSIGQGQINIEGLGVVTFTKKDITRMKNLYLAALSRFHKYIRSAKKKATTQARPEDFKGYYKRMVFGEPMRVLLSNAYAGEFPAADGRGSVLDSMPLARAGLMTKATAMNLFFLNINHGRLLDYQAQPLPALETVKGDLAGLQSEAAVKEYYSQFSSKTFVPSAGMLAALNGNVPSVYAYDRDGYKVLNSSNQNVLEILTPRQREERPISADGLNQSEVQTIISLIAYDAQDAESQAAQDYDELMARATEAALLDEMYVSKDAKEASREALAADKDLLKKFNSAKNTRLGQIRRAAAQPRR